MTDINRQKFLAELGKLLTFMYEEDRQTALSMYNAMFDRVEDEMALIQKLVSPTRQAVLIARAYDAKERKLQVHAQSRGGEEGGSGEIPQFVMVIDRIAQDLPAGHAPAPRAVLEDQFSLFEEASLQEEPEEEPAPAEEPAPEEEPVQAEEPDEYSSLNEVEGFIPIEIPDISVPGMEMPPVELPAQSEEAPAPAAEEQPVQTEEEKVDAFMADFSLPAEAIEPAAEPVEEPQGEQQVMEGFEAAEERSYTAPVQAYAPPATVRKPRIALLILYILLAVPVGIVGMLFLLLLTFFTLGVAGITVVAGIMLFTAAFGGFSVFADILVVLGAAVIVLALGLLLLWLFVWFIGGAMVGFIRGLIGLGGKWCYKEVAAV